MEKLEQDILIGDLIINQYGVVDFVVESDDEDYLLQNEIYILIGNYGCELYRKITNFNDIQNCFVFYYKREIYKKIKTTY